MRVSLARSPLLSSLSFFLFYFLVSKTNYICQVAKVKFLVKILIDCQSNEQKHGTAHRTIRIVKKYIYIYEHERASKRANE